MGGEDIDHTFAMASVRRALGGEVFPALRAVTVAWGPRSVTFRAYVHGVLSDDDAEALSRVETEVIADFPPEVVVTHEVIRCDAPRPIADPGPFAFEADG